MWWTASRCTARAVVDNAAYKRLKQTHQIYFISTVTPLSTFSFPISTHEHFTFNFHYGTASFNLSVAQKGGICVEQNSHLRN